MLFLLFFQTPKEARVHLCASKCCLEASSSFLTAPGSIVFSSECLCCEPLYFKRRAAAAHWDCCVYSICMHAVWVCAESEWERDEHKRASVWMCAAFVHAGSRCWDLRASPDRECRGPWTLLCFLLTRRTHTLTCRGYAVHRSGRGWGLLRAPLAHR